MTTNYFFQSTLHKREYSDYTVYKECVESCIAGMLAGMLAGRNLSVLVNKLL